MPRATVSTDVEQFDLKTLAGGWVKLKKMSYGQKLERAQIATDMEIAMEKGSKRQTASVDVMQTKVALFDFRNCLVEHNLFADDEETILINLTTAAGLATLDPKVGDEIGKLIDDMNNYEEDEELGN